MLLGSGGIGSEQRKLRGFAQGELLCPRLDVSCGISPVAARPRLSAQASRPFSPLRLLQLVFYEELNLVTWFVESVPWNSLAPSASSLQHVLGICWEANPL